MNNNALAVMGYPDRSNLERKNSNRKSLATKNERKNQNKK